jgi:uncharacterized membrane protein YfcA
MGGMGLCLTKIANLGGKTTPALSCWDPMSHHISNIRYYLLFFNNSYYLCGMREEKNNSFWDILIWVTVIMAGTWGLEGLLLHYTKTDWVKLVGILIALVGLVWASRHESGDSERRTPDNRLSLGEAVTAFSTALGVFSIIFLPDSDASLVLRIALLVLLIPLQTWGLYRARRKKEEKARQEEAEKREPLELRDRVARAGSKPFIVISHAKQLDLELEMDERMFLYRLPDGRFLVLYRKDVELEAFQGTLADFRSVVDADEDVTGYFGQPLNGAHPGAPQAFQCNLERVCRPVDFNPSSISISSAVPV